MKTTRILATHVTKSKEVDIYEDGCQPNTYTEYELESRPITFSTLKEIEDRYDLDSDPSAWYVTDNRISYNRLENEYEDKPDETQLELWKKGQKELYSVTYDFYVVLIQEDGAKEEVLRDMLGINT